MKIGRLTVAKASMFPEGDARNFWYASWTRPSGYQRWMVCLQTREARRTYGRKAFSLYTQPAHLAPCK